MLTLTHSREAWDVCVYTDALKNHWGEIVAQLAPKALSKPRDNQNHSPLALLSGSFRGSMLRWATIEKESFAIVETCKD